MVLFFILVLSVHFYYNNLSQLHIVSIMSFTTTAIFQLVQTWHGIALGQHGNTGECLTDLTVINILLNIIPTPRSGQLLLPPHINDR